MIFIISAFATFAYVFLRSLQQLNVVHNQYAWVVPTSVAMCTIDVGVILLIVKADSILLGVTNGFGAGFGALSGMWLHNKLRGTK